MFFSKLTVTDELLFKINKGDSMEICTHVDHGITRRTFVGTAGATVACGAALAASGRAVAAESGASEAEPTTGTASTQAPAPTPDETIECDVVVVGSGISGLSCTLEAAGLGLKVVVLEKEGFLGGTLSGTEGIFGLSSQLQTDAGLEMPERWQLVQKELEYANYRTDPLLWSDVIDASGGNIDWLADKGITFPTIDRYLGQSDFETFHWWEGETGAAAAEALGAEAQSVATIMLSTQATELVLEDGTVRGVYAQSDEGVTYRVDAKAVVLASGGIANDLALLGEKTGMDLSESTSLFPIRCVGDGLAMALSVGAQETPISMMNVFGVHGYAPTDPVAIAGTLQPTNLFVNQNAERFMAEDLYLKKFFALVTNSWKSQTTVYGILSRPQAEAWETQGCICGVATVKAGDALVGLVDQIEEAAATEGTGVFKGETIEELAGAMGIDPEALAATVARYNEQCAAGHDADFGKSDEYLVALEEGPLYAVHPVYSVFATMGGILIDRQAHVLDTNGTAIPGLYSTGTASCGLYKETYCYQVSGGMNAYCCYTGRTAARVIAEEIGE